jgi:site-specific DNA-cytosine methylase
MKYDALGINIFGGGFTLGVLQSKHFNVIGQWEQCDAGAKTFDMNPQYFKGIWRPLLSSQWDPFMSPHFIYANPPCAPWSGANTRKGMTVDVRRKDPRLAMTSLTMETAMALRPRAFALETVARGYSMGREYYDSYAEQWIKLGYGVTYYLTDALLLGVPSTRSRFHFLAHKDELELTDTPNTVANFVPRTVSMAVGDLETHFGHLPHHFPKKMSRNAHELCRLTKQGRLLNGTDDEENEELQWAVIACEWKPSFLNRRLVWDAPGFTLVNLEQHVHPRRPRFLTWREGLRLAGYPDDFMVAQPQGATQAVLPPIGKHIAEIVYNGLESGKKAQRDLNLIDHRDYAKPYRPGKVRDLIEEEGL